MSTHFKTIIFVGSALIGIAVGYGTHYGSEIAVAGAALGVILGGLHMWERKRDTPTSHEASRGTHAVALPLFLCLSAWGIALGIVRVQLVEEKNIFACEEVCTFDASIVSSPEIKDTYQTIVVRPSDRDTLDVQLRVPLYPRYEIGDTLRVTGKAKVPEIIYPHDSQKGFDYAAYLFTKNVGSEILFPRIEVIGNHSTTLRSILGRWKENLVARMNMYVVSPASSLASGMLFGNSSMSKELLQTFRTAGLSHIIVLSGFNIAIVIAFMLFMLAFLPLVVRIAFAVIAVILFDLMVGAEASVVRATVMAFIALLSTLVGREYVARQALIISLFAIVMYEPYALLHDVSLHLSFLATAGIVYASAPLALGVRKYIRNNSFTDILSTTIAAYFSTLPYVMHTFGTVSVYALFTNILALPLVPLAMLFSALVVCASYISNTLSLLLGYVDTFILTLIIFSARAAEELPFAQIPLSLSSLAMWIAYAVVVVVTIFALQKKIDETLPTEEGVYLTGIIKY